MKVGIFTDPHYSSAKLTCGRRLNSQSLRKIKEAIGDFERHNCDLSICLGDLIDCEETHEREIENLREIAEVLNKAKFPTICLMGNHDAFAFDENEFYQILGENHRPADIHQKDLHLLFIDACYFSDGRHYTRGNCDWQDTYFPFADSLESEIHRCRGKVYLFMHQNLDPMVPSNHQLSNADRLRKMLSENPAVKTVFQGHYHAGYRTLWNGIQYITLPAMCECEHAFEIAEI